MEAYMNVEIFKNNSYRISELITKAYSTSFSLATSLLEIERRVSIYAVYGFVRLADEIVDSFHDFDKQFLLSTLEKELDYALQNGISTNPVLLAFADTVIKYKINKDHIDAFLSSMKYDLTKTHYNNKEEIKQYIYGSADVVGLMCLRIFCNGDDERYQKLLKPAQSLGCAFQKVNFLRDLKADVLDLGRIYFPELTKNNLNDDIKQQLVQDIENDFKYAYEGIKHLPGRSKLAVYIAYSNYKAVLNKIKRTPARLLMNRRIRISNIRKMFIIIKSFVQYNLKLI